MNTILFDDEIRLQLLPFTFTRPVAEIRIGILTIREKWEKHLTTGVSYLSADYLQEKFPLKSSADNLLINGSVLPDADLVERINSLQPGEKLMKNVTLLAVRCDAAAINDFQEDGTFNSFKSYVYDSEIDQIRHCWDIFAMNGKALADDYKLLTSNRSSQPLPTSNQVIAPENIFLEEGVVVECAILNASQGPIYLGKNSEIMEGSMIRGGFSLGEGSQVKMGSKIYGPTTIGPFSKVGGEINNSVIFGYSNKAHDGFLGNSVIGEWCNLGADSNNSNLKNNYSQIKVWSYKEEAYVNTGLQFCGLLMGDHSKCSINTMFNTGTVVGVSANIFGTGFPPKFVPGFSWGGSEGFSTYRLEESMEVAQRVYERRKMNFDVKDQAIFRYLYDLTTRFRAW